MIYEHRVYNCTPGSLPKVLHRFETIVLPFWKSYGIRPVGFWTVMLGASQQSLYYMLEWDSLAEREQRFNAFTRDKDWLARRAETEKDGALVASVTSTILQPTSFSAMS